MLQFVIGRAGSGKTEYLRRYLAEQSLKGKSGLMLVPEQYTFATEKAMLALAGPQRANATGVYSFTRLAETVFRRLGGAAGRRLSDGGRRILMACAIAACEDHLEVYRSAAKSGRVTDLMLTAVNEMKLCGISPAQLTQTAGALPRAGLSQKLRELGLIYGAYEALVEGSFLDSRDDLTRLRQALEGGGLFQGQIIAVDSFEGFTVQELRVLEELIRQADHVLVSLCTDGLSQDDPSGLFALVDRTRFRLTRLAEDNGVKVLPPVVLTGAPRFHNENLKLLEAQLFCPQDALPAPDHQGVEVFQARDVFEEAEYVAASIRRLAAGGMRYRDITILCRDPRQYYGSLDVALKKRDIPCFLSQPVRVDAEPVTRLALGAFEAVQGGFGTDELLELLKTGVSGFTAEEASQLENYAFLWRIKGAGWREPWVRHPKGFGREWTPEDQEELAELNRLRERLISPLERFAAATRDASGQEASQAVYQLLMDFGLEETLPACCLRLEQAGEEAAAARQRRVWDLLMETLDQMYSILGDRKTSRERYYRLLREVLAAEDLSEIPQTVDQVIFGTAEQARQTTPRAAFLMGVTQGDFPLTPRSSGVFSDAERRELISRDLPLGDPLEQKSIEERYLAYSVASLPSERLYISWPGSVGGEDKEPSELVAGVLGVFPTLRPLPDLPDGFFANSREAAFSRMAARWREDTPQAAALRQFIAQDPEYAGRLAALERAAGSREQRVEDPALARKLYGKDLFFSPSQVEAYYSCPFKYYCRYGLNARERRPAEVDVLQYGTLMHYLFEKIFSQPPEIRAVRSREELLDLVRELIAAYAQESMGGMELLSSRERYRLERLAQSACLLIAHVERELAQSQFVPESFELRLGPKVPPLRVELGDGPPVTVGGTIDRVDLYRSPEGRDYVRVVDYKTGRKAFKLADVLYGLNMQMLVYLAALVEGGGRYPAGILYMPAAEPSVSVDREADPAAVERAADRQLKMSGLVLDDREIIEAMEAGAKGEFIPAALKKDGTADSRSSVLGPEALGTVLEYSKRLIASMGRELSRGEASARPSLKNENACRFCPYGAICGKEFGERDVEQERLTPKEALARMEAALAPSGPSEETNQQGGTT